MKKVCVFCGSRPGTGPEFVIAARALGEQLVKEQIGLVYGGGNVGLMGAIASAVHSAHNSPGVLGVIPTALQAVEVSGSMVGDVIVVADMHARKALMAQHADGFIAMPGGFGTLEEVLEVMTWQQLGFHAKPIGFLNISGYYDPLLAFFQQCVTMGFVKAEHNTVLVSDDPAKLLQLMRDFRAPPSLLQQNHAASLAALGADVSHSAAEAPPVPAPAAL